MEGAYNATRFLIDKGCKDIGFISSNNVNKLSGERFKGYKKALLESNIEINEDKIFLQNYTIDTGYEGTNELLKNTRIDGICCGNDLIAIGAIRALREKRIDVPGDIRVIGFDDIQISKYLDPPLTTIRQPIYEMGEEAVKMLISIIEKKGVAKTKILKTTLIERRSS